MILTCIKTGRWWPYPTEAAAIQGARDRGLKDYTVGVG